MAYDSRQEEPMKRALFFIAYFLAPAIPVALYMRSLGGGAGVYSGSVVLGITAFILICNQYILASRPTFIVKALGLKSLLAFHSIMPIVLIGMAGMHSQLKEAAGFSDDTLQATLGSATLAVFIAAAVLAILFLANINLPIALKLREFRKWAQDRLALSYRLTRAFHNITVVAGVAIMVHVLLASSSDFKVNPVGAGWMIAWLALSLGLYARYRLNGRKVPAARAPA